MFRSYSRDEIMLKDLVLEWIGDICSQRLTSLTQKVKFRQNSLLEVEDLIY